MPRDPNQFYDGGLAVVTYDLFAARNGRLDGDVDFYLDLARRHGGPVLELAAGTGRILAPLVSAGFEVVGVDVSRAMLDVAEHRLAGLESGRWSLIQAPMQSFETHQRFGLVLIPARALQHLVDPADQRETLERARRHLLPGGRLAIDLFDPNLEYCVGTPPVLPPREVTDPTSGRRFRRSCLGRFTDPFAQTTGEEIRIEELDEAGGVIASQDTSWTLKWSTRQEMAYLLELCGFVVEAQFGDFQGGPPTYAGEQVWVARPT